MKQFLSYIKIHHQISTAIAISSLFFILYSILTVIRHNYFGSFGFDLGIADQIVWKYSTFRLPITTVQHFPFTSLLSDHVELIYPLISPLYWIFSDAKTLLLLQAFLISFSAIPIYLFAKSKKITPLLRYILMINYLLFFGVQNALWFDVHSLTLAAGILPWFLYFIDKQNIKWSIITFLLAISCKEDIALFTLFISGIYFLKRRGKSDLLFMGASILYLFIIFAIYFPHFTRDGYRYQDKNGLFANLHLSYFYDTDAKKKIVSYALASFGFIPLLAPLFLLPFVADLAHYFIFGHSVSAAQEFFMHYRVTLALFLVWPTVIAIARFPKYLNSRLVAIYLLCCTLFFQYYLHLPLSYLAKSWFWKQPASIISLDQAISYLPKDASVVSQNNITPHVSHRDLVFTLWPDTKRFPKNSPCGKEICNWFRWSGNPSYLIIDTSSEWDIRHFLVNREEYLLALSNMEKASYIKKEKAFSTTVIYKTLRKPTADPL